MSPIAEGHEVAGILPRPTLTKPSAAEEPPARPLLRLSLRATLGELVFGSAVAAIVSLVVQLAVAHVHVTEPSFVPVALAALGGALIMGTWFWLLVFARPVGRKWAAGRRLWPAGVWVSLSALITLTLALPLESTRFYYGGSSVDNGFRLQYMTRLASSPALADFNYRHIAPYYPGAWFWLGGRFANLIGWEGWAAYKPYALTWLAITGVVAFTLWSLVLRRRLALLAALATSISGMLQGVDEPYAWPSAAWLAPIAVLAWYVLRRESRAPRWTSVLIGGYVGFAAITYTLHFGFATLVIVTIAVIAGVSRVRAGRRVWATVRELFLRLLPIGVTGAVVSLLTWLPYLLATGFLLHNPHGLAQHYLPADSAFLPVPMTDPTPFGALCLAGVIWMLIRCRRNQIAAAMLTITCAVYCWFALSTLALVAKTTLLAFRLNVILDAVLATAGVLALVELVEFAREKLHVRYAQRIAVIACTVGLLGAITLTQGAMGVALNGSEQQAYQDYYPTGSNSMGQHDTTNVAAWYPQIYQTVAALTGRPPQQNIVLTTDYKLMSFQPYWGFQEETPHYANPLGSYNARAAEIQQWSHASSSTQLAAMLGRSQFEPPNVFILNKNAASLSVTLKSDSFPQQPNVRDYDVPFNPAAFSGPEFMRQDVGPYAVIVHR
jgi:galactan 5-O-arabinofuranosyltransferase